MLTKQIKIEKTANELSKNQIKETHLCPNKLATNNVQGFSCQRQGRNLSRKTARLCRESNPGLQLGSQALRHQPGHTFKIMLVITINI